MYSPSLDLLHRWVNPHICCFTTQQFKVSASPSTLHRIKLVYTEGHAGPPTLVVKYIEPTWLDDLAGADREQRFYAELSPCLTIKRPCVYYAGIEEETGYRLIMLEDVAQRFRFPSSTHAWTSAEAECVMRTYAHLHGQGKDVLPPPDDRAWMWTIQRRTWDKDELLEKFDCLVQRKIWQPLRRLEHLINTVLALEPEFSLRPITLLHNDVAPQNVGLPDDLSQTALLVDWEMAGWGLPELDLAYMFLLPFRNTRQIERSRALAVYWHERQAIEGVCPPLEERCMVQRYADALWALRQITVAQRVAQRPFPAGSAPQAYWDAMVGVLHERLRQLCDGI